MRPVMSFALILLTGLVCPVASGVVPRPSAAIAKLRGSLPVQQAAVVTFEERDDAGRPIAVLQLTLSRAGYLRQDLQDLKTSATETQASMTRE